METQDRSNFEETWRRALDGAEVLPDPRVWNGIQQRLDNPGRKAKHIFLIKFAIAASFLFAMSTAGLYFFQSQQNAVDTIEGITMLGDEAVSEPEKESAVVDTEIKHAESEEEHQDQLGLQKNNVNAPPSLWQDALALGESSLIHLGDQAAGFMAGLSVSLFDQQETDPVQMQPVPVLSLFPRGSQSGGWASMNFAGGGMNVAAADGVSAFHVADSENLSNSTFVSRTSTENPESSILFGVGFGKSIGERWVLQGGANYAVRKASGTSNLASAGNTVAVGFDANSVTQTAAYNVEHRLAYVSVPVQVGYKVIDRKVNLTVLAGFAGDMRVSHRVTDQDGELSSVRLREESNFNSYAASAIVTAELSYPLGDHYRVSAYPQVRKYVTPLQEGGELPVSLEMGVRLSYMF